MCVLGKSDYLYLFKIRYTVLVPHVSHNNILTDNNWHCLMENPNPKPTHIMLAKHICRIFTL